MTLITNPRPSSVLGLLDCCLGYQTNYSLFSNSSSSFNSRSTACSALYNSSCNIVVSGYSLLNTSTPSTSALTKYLISLTIAPLRSLHMLDILVGMLCVRLPCLCCLLLCILLLARQCGHRTSRHQMCIGLVCKLLGLTLFASPYSKDSEVTVDCFT